MKVTPRKKAAKPKKAKNVYPCPYCHKSFENSSNWGSHVKLHTDERPYSCHLCPYTCKVRKYLTRHVNKTHSAPTAHPCHVCGKRFHYECALRAHERVHTREKPYKCDQCDKAFSSSYSLNGHKLIHTGEKPFACEYCDYACRDSSTIRRHMERHRGISKDYPCSICNKNFKKKESLQIHVDEVHFELDTRKHPCEQCDKSFKTKKSLRFHVVTVHIKSNRVKCEICGRVTTKNNLQSHMKRHIDVRPYRCSYKPCGKRFKDMGDLKRHQVIHYPDYHHICTVCNRRFPRKFRLKKHMLNGCQRVQCHHCGQLFTAKKYLAQHIKNAHGPCPKSREYLCDVCDMVTYSRRGIIQHLKYGHGTEKDTKCEICRKDYFKWEILKEHYLSHHNLKYTLMDQKKDDIIPIKEEAEDDDQDMADPSEFMYEVDITKHEIEDPPSEPPPEPPQTPQPPPEEYQVDADSITYSLRVMSEDVSRVLVESGDVPDVFQQLLVGHVPHVPTSQPKLPKQIVDEEKQKRVEKRLEKLLTTARKRNQWVVLEKLRRQYNRRIKMANSGGEKKEQKSIRYFKKPENNNDTNNTQNNTENDEQTIINDDDDDDERNKQESDDVNKQKDSEKENAEKINENDDIGADSINDDGDEKVDDDDEKDIDYKESDLESEEETNPKIKFNTQQCYICFKLFKTKADLKYHCNEHFDICNEKMLKKCPFCGYVSNRGMSRHLKLVHNVSVDTPFARIKEKDTEEGSKYVFQIDKDCDLDVIPSVSNLNKIASMKIDAKNRASKNFFVGTTKLVKKGGDWMVQKQKVDLKDEFLLPEFSKEDYLGLKAIGDDYLSQIRSLSILAKKKGYKMLFPCQGCDKICLGMAALKLHSRKHEANPKKFKPKVWKNKILNGHGGKYRHVNKAKNKKKKYAVNKQNNNTVVENTQSNSNTVKKTRFIEKIANKKENDTPEVAHRFADPNPVKNNHNCDRQLIEFYYNNIKGGDIEFWQFLKIFNKMSRENVNDFKDLENRDDFGIMHNFVKYDETSTKNTAESNKEDSVEKIVSPPKKTVRNKKKVFTRKIMISKKEYLRRMALKNQMRERLEQSKS